MLLVPSIITINCAQGTEEIYAFITAEQDYNIVECLYEFD